MKSRAVLGLAVTPVLEAGTGDIGISWTLAMSALFDSALVAAVARNRVPFVLATFGAVVPAQDQ
jgi:hypothetical protein